MSRSRAHGAATSLRLEPADPFDLIRWLARSQSDPRKAVAELVQNSIDAGAKHVSVERRRLRRRLCLVVRDDGEGVLPDMGRQQALHYLAKHIGHSRKARLGPAERAKQVGKYGVGLLGFWSVGHFLELRTRVNGSALHVLRLEEESPHARRTEEPVPLFAPDTYTEAVVVDLHDAAKKVLSGRRLTDYLAAELRGQILQSGVEIVVFDGVARGSAQKTFEVAPKRFVGERLALPAEVPVPGYPPLRVELYLARGAERPAIQVACAGTLVADDVSALSTLGLAQAPWVGAELSGIVDFGGFTVPPGTRRGVAPNKAALAFVQAMEGLAPAVFAELGRLEEERRAAADRDVVRDLRRALRGLRSRLPRYELPGVGGPREAGAGEGEREVGGEPEQRDEAPAEVRIDTPLPFPPGPLDAVRIAPKTVRVAPGGEHRVRAVATDRNGQRLADVGLTWTIERDEPGWLSVRGEGPRPALVASPHARLGAAAALRVDAEKGDFTATASVPIEVAETDDALSLLGIPEPHLVSDADGSWRTRMHGDRWEVNDEHEDYRAVRSEPRARVRYLLALLAKELVLRIVGRPEASDDLEGMVEILAHAERNLRGS